MRGIAPAITGMAIGLLAILVYLLIKLISAGACRLSLLLGRTGAAFPRDWDDNQRPCVALERTSLATSVGRPG